MARDPTIRYPGATIEIAYSNAMMKLILCVVLVCAATIGFATSALGQPPRVFVLDGAALEAVRTRIRAQDVTLQPAIDQLKRDADKALQAGPYSVVNKDVVPSSGDKHDYMSQAPYWWPNPNTASGLPYIRRDGERNPEIYKNRNRLDLGEMIDAAETLALGYYLTGDNRYADRAAVLLRTWFLDPATRMNPHLEFGQHIPGINKGRGEGLIETRLLVRVVDAIGLLAESKAWTAADQRAIEQWFSQFLQWMLESEHGRDEAASENNHGTYYDVQVVSYALFLNKKELATTVLSEAAKRRIATQIEPDGRQPLELARTKAWSYSVGNLAGLIVLARLGEHVDIDLWSYESVDGRSIHAALDFLAPYALGEREWTYPQINGFSADLLHPLLRYASLKFPEEHSHTLRDKLPPLHPASRSRLIVSPLDPIGRLHVR
jgi:hypothetical protein